MDSNGASLDCYGDFSDRDPGLGVRYCREIKKKCQEKWDLIKQLAY